MLTFKIFLFFFLFSLFCFFEGRNNVRITSNKLFHKNEPNIITLHSFSSLQMRRNLMWIPSYHYKYSVVMEECLYFLFMSLWCYSKNQTKPKVPTSEFILMTIYSKVQLSLSNASMKYIICTSSTQTTTWKCHLF